MADRAKTVFSIFKDIFASAFAGHEPEGIGIAAGEGAVKMTGPSNVGTPNWQDMQVPGMAISPKDLPMRESSEAFGVGTDIYSRRQRYSQFEMLEDMIAEVDAALNTYADEASSYDENDHTMHVKCKDSKIKEEAEFMLFKLCKVDRHIWGWTRNLCRDGDLFLEVIIDPSVPDIGVMGLQELDPGTVWRIQSNRGKLLEFQQTMYGPDYNVVVRDLIARANADQKPDEYIFWSYRSSKQPNVIRFAPAQMLHLRIGGKKRGFYPYGVSILAPARRPALNLKLMEDAMLVYRVSRAAERRVYYVDVGLLPGPDVTAFIKSFQDNVKRKKVFNERTQSVDETWNPMPIRRTTPVPLLDGRAPTIEELASEFDAGKENWVYSVLDDSGGRVVPGKVVWCGKNYRCKAMRRIWFDNGGYVDFAPEHPMVMRDGSRKRADELVNGDSVMPFDEKTIISETTDRIQSTIDVDHRVDRVDVLEDEDDVYCMTVVGPDGEDNRHNFAIRMHGSDGKVFCCNSVDDDLFIPVRPSGGTKVETLPGACLALDTRIPLLDGRVLSLSEMIAEHEGGKQNWVYSCDPDTGHIVPGIVSWAGITRRNAEVLKITLDNGQTITCTPDHKFPVIGKGFVEAHNLEVGESMIPFNLRQEKIRPSHNTVYNQVYDVEKKNWRFVHRMVAEEFRGFRQRQREGFAVAKDTPKFRKRHEHKKSINAVMWADPGHREKVFEKQRIQFPKSLMTFTSDCFRRGMNGQSALDLLNQQENLRKEFLDANAHIKRKGVIHEDGITFLQMQKMVVAHGYASIEQARAECSHYNHKIVSVEMVDQHIDTGTLTIDANELHHSYHTFALASGIFSRNSNLSEIDDTVYFRKKFYVSVKIPPGFLDQTVESQTNRLTLSSIDMKFAKVVLRIQKELAAGFTELCYRHLELQRVPRSSYEDLEVVLTPSSDWKEMARSEVVRDRVDRASSANSLAIFDDKFIMTEFLKMPEDQAEEQIKARRAQEIEKAEIQAQAQMIQSKAQMEAERAGPVNQARAQQAVVELSGAPGAGTPPTESEINAALPPEGSTPPEATMVSPEATGSPEGTGSLSAEKLPTALTPSDREVEIEDRNL